MPGPFQPSAFLAEAPPTSHPVWAAPLASLLPGARQLSCVRVQPASPSRILLRKRWWCSLRSSLRRLLSSLSWQIKSLHPFSRATMQDLSSGRRTTRLAPLAGSLNCTQDLHLSNNSNPIRYRPIARARRRTPTPGRTIHSLGPMSSAQRHSYSTLRRPLSSTRGLRPSRHSGGASAPGKAVLRLGLSSTRVSDEVRNSKANS